MPPNESEETPTQYGKQCTAALSTTLRHLLWSASRRGRQTWTNRASRQRCQKDDIDNLAFLCLEHHDLYDSRSRQSKGLTIGEVKVFKAELEEAIAVALTAQLSLAVEEQSPWRWEGVYRWEKPNSSAELEIQNFGGGRYAMTGVAFWGTKNEHGPNFGELDTPGKLIDENLVVSSGDYRLTLSRTSVGLVAAETFESSAFGLNVTFAGTYEKVAHGAEALPQTPPRVFESEFWPEEGRPVFVARVSPLTVRARPSTDAPIIGELAVDLGKRVDYAGFRYRTIRPGTVIAHSEGGLSGRNLGSKDYVSHANYYEDGGEQTTLVFKAGDRFEYLQYRAEGTGFLRWQGLVIDGDLPWFDPSSPFKLIAEPIAESWVQMVDLSAGQQGWVLADEELKEVDREF